MDYCPNFEILFQPVLTNRNNMELTTEDFVKFITSYENADTASLLLSRNKWKNIDIDLAVNTICTRKKLKSKVPSWYAVPELVYPSKLSGEQCSSEETAFLKASIAEKFLKEIHSYDTYERPGVEKCGFRIADLTGGMGVDSFAFSKIAEKVLYNEMNPSLAEASRRNFRILKADNIQVTCRMIIPSETYSQNGTNHTDASGTGETSLQYTESFNGQPVSPAALLCTFKPDLIFLDPARRNSEGKKVFLIEDCSPDVLTMKDELLSISRFIMIKLSPMADIDMVLERLGRKCRELYITASGGECKELIILMDREWDGECTINAGGLIFLRSEEKSSQAILPENQEKVKSAKFLFEPGKALMKSGAFNLICSRLHLTKLAKSTHLYISEHISEKDECRKYGKVFRIIDTAHLDKTSIRTAGKLHPKAEVTARNIPMTSEMLRKKLNVSSGSNTHIFGAGVEYERKKESFLFITEKQS